ncbi:shikimate kinase [Nocardiopsis potens]|uniref:shikimate kinase n=1 Tax=Nocardiopsis potens TaxID=1246458 RepID=UPI0003451E4B|nr:shikimate kinase [Nocardiopsis potens]
MSTPITVLIGSPGAGKSTVGRALAERLGVALMDTDDEIEARAGKPVSDIFVEDGEEAFRALERAVVAEALAGWPGVVAVGGGAVVNRETRADLARHHVVYLQVDFDDAARRVGLNQARPLLAGNPRARLKSLLEERLPVYEELATATVPTSGRHPEEVVDAIVALLPERDGGRA